MPGGLGRAHTDTQGMPLPRMPGGLGARSHTHTRDAAASDALPRALCLGCPCLGCREAYGRAHTHTHGMPLPRMRGLGCPASDGRLGMRCLGWAAWDALPRMRGRGCAGAERRTGEEARHTGEEPRTRAKAPPHAGALRHAICSWPFAPAANCPLPTGRCERGSRAGVLLCS